MDTETLRARLPLILGLLAAVGASVGASYYFTSKDLESSRARLEELQSRLKSIAGEKSKEDQKLTELRDAIANANVLKKQNSTLAEEVATRTKELMAAKAKWDQFSSQFHLDIDAVRKNASSTPIPSLENPKGDPYMNVKILDIGSNFVALEHDAGMKRLSLKDLPAELSDRLLLDWRPTYTLPEHPNPEPEDAALIKSLTLIAPPAPDIPAEVSPAAKAEADKMVQAILATNAKGFTNRPREEIQQMLGAMKTWILDALRQRAELETQYTSLAHAADLSGGSSARQQRETLRNAYQRLDAQIEKANREYKNLLRNLPAESRR